METSGVTKNKWPLIIYSILCTSILYVIVKAPLTLPLYQQYNYFAKVKTEAKYYRYTCNDTSRGTLTAITMATTF